MSKEGRQELRGPTWSDKAGNCGDLNKMGFDMRWGQKQKGMCGDLKEETFQMLRSVELLGVSTIPVLPQGEHTGRISGQGRGQWRIQDRKRTGERGSQNISEAGREDSGL